MTEIINSRVSIIFFVGFVPRPPPTAPPSRSNVYRSSERPLTATVNMLDTLKAHPPGVDS